MIPQVSIVINNWHFKIKSGSTWILKCVVHNKTKIYLEVNPFSKNNQITIYLVRALQWNKIQSIFYYSVKSTFSNFLPPKEKWVKKPGLLLRAWRSASEFLSAISPLAICSALHYTVIYTLHGVLYTKPCIVPKIVYRALHCAVFTSLHCEVYTMYWMYSALLCAFCTTVCIVTNTLYFNQEYIMCATLYIVYFMVYYALDCVLFTTQLHFTTLSTVYYTIYCVLQGVLCTTLCNLHYTVNCALNCELCITLCIEYFIV